MDEELKQLEVELQRLRPAAPSAGLLARLERELKPSRRRAAFGWWMWAAALPVAAALAVMIALAVGPDRTAAPRAAVPPVAVAAAPAAAFKPVAAENFLYAARDEGLVTLADGTAARRERLHYVDVITWKNPRTNASVRWSVPCEEVRVVPVNFQ